LTPEKYKCAQLTYTNYCRITLGSGKSNFQQNLAVI